MIACASPGFSSANHTINTLRYSDRLKEKAHVNNNIQNNIPKQNPNLNVNSNYKYELSNKEIIR